MIDNVEQRMWLHACVVLVQNRAEYRPTTQYNPALRIAAAVAAVVLTVRVLLTVPPLETST
jgi:hypothetical protein